MTDPSSVLAAIKARSSERASDHAAALAAMGIPVVDSE